MATFPGVEFLKDFIQVQKEVHVLYKTSSKEASRRNRAVDVKEMY